MRLLLVWPVNALALPGLPYVFPWVRVDSFTAALLAALLPQQRNRANPLPGP